MDLFTEKQLLALLFALAVLLFVVAIALPQPKHPLRIRRK